MNDREPFETGIGRTNELALRVSVATLVRVLVENSKDGEEMLALENRATLRKDKAGHVVDVKAQPFGGAIQIRNLRTLREILGDFHFDCEESRSEQDFRIFIRPSAWEQVRDFCLGHFNHIDDPVLESDPGRELAEEFAETLGVRLRPDQFVCQPTGTIVESIPSPTENAGARGSLTARIYRIFEARIVDPALANAMSIKSEGYSNRELEELALADLQSGGRGWANAVLTLSLKRLCTAYLATSAEARDHPVSFQNHQLDETVAAVLEIPVPKYRTMP